MSTRTTGSDGDVQRTKDAKGADTSIWWREPLMWLVIAGPVMAMVGGFTILWFALRIPDPVMTTDYQRQHPLVEAIQEDKALLPALVGRNHAATPNVDVPAKVR